MSSGHLGLRNPALFFICYLWPSKTKTRSLHSHFNVCKSPEHLVKIWVGLGVPHSFEVQGNADAAAGFWNTL